MRPLHDEHHGTKVCNNADSCPTLRTGVVLENSNVEKLASNLYLSVHTLPQEDYHDTDDASAGEVYPILMP
jgi:hypothetical protein